MCSLTTSPCGRNQMASKIVSFINLKGGLGKSTLPRKKARFTFYMTVLRESFKSLPSALTFHYSAKRNLYGIYQKTDC